MQCNKQRLLWTAFVESVTCLLLHTRASRTFKIASAFFGYECGDHIRPRKLINGIIRYKCFKWTKFTFNLLLKYFLVISNSLFTSKKMLSQVKNNEVFSLLWSWGGQYGWKYQVTFHSCIKFGHWATSLIAFCIIKGRDYREEAVPNSSVRVPRKSGVTWHDLV